MGSNTILSFWNGITTSQKTSRHGPHDLAKIIEDFTGQWPSFDDIVWRNLKERKKSINDLKHDPVNRTDAIAACKSDVRQTYKLFRLYEAGKFIYPAGLGAQPCAPADGTRAVRSDRR
jgi:hypothetical protein